MALPMLDAAPMAASVYTDALDADSAGTIHTDYMHPVDSYWRAQEKIRANGYNGCAFKRFSFIHSNSKLLDLTKQHSYNIYRGEDLMETKDIILKLRTKIGFSQDELAEKVYVTRQAVSRWENGETVPNTETLKLLSKLFDVSINTILGSPRKLICQCCGMPLDDGSISKETDGTFNEEYCKWCYTNGEFTYTDLEKLTDFLAAHMSNENWSSDQARIYFNEQLPKLNYWQQHKK